MTQAFHANPGRRAAALPVSETPTIGLPFSHAAGARGLSPSGSIWQPAEMRTARTAIGWLLVVMLGALTTGAALAYAATAKPALLFTFADTQIDESSGLGTSSYGDGIYYTHNDSGDTARFFAVNSSGASVAIYTLRGATAHDWEDMETGTDWAGRPVLYFGDIGDNASNRSEIDVYQVPEPRGPSADVPWVRYRFHYPDGPHNAEALMVDPHTHRLYVATKVSIGVGTLYEAPAVLSTTDINVLAEVRSGIPTLTTSGDISPDGKVMVLLTYFSAYWASGVNGTLHAFPIPEQRQDEAIAFTRDGRSVIVGSEGVHSLVYEVPLPAAALATAPPPPSAPASSAVSSLSALASLPPAAQSPSAATSTSPVPAKSHSSSMWIWVVLVVVLGVLLLVARQARFWPFRSR